MRRRWQIGAVLAALALAAAACGDDGEYGAPATTSAPTAPVPTTEAIPVPTTPPTTTDPGPITTGRLARADVPYSTDARVTDDQLDSLVAGNTEFALDLLRLIGSNGDNTILSPFSIAAALTMTYAGARELTAEQMGDVLHLALDGIEAHEARNDLSLRIADTAKPGPVDDREPLQVSIANSLWGQHGFAFEQDFLETLASAYDTGVRLVDFIADTEGARTDINEWVAEQTRDRILDLLPPGSVTTDTRLVLTNAIWFKASWAMPFDPDQTEPRSFHLLDGSEVTVPMMNGGGRMLYARGEGYQAARIGYAGDASMLVVAPDSGSFDEIVAGSNGDFLAAVDQSLGTHELSLAMPKFEFDSQLSLRTVLADLGMADAFSPTLADFEGISTQRDDLYLQDVLHKAFISVDEEGTEAAAATASLIGVTSLPPPATLTLDNPFIYLIRHNSTGEILFAGTVTNPS
jgi:serpin B